jgi:hypothetical protein
MSPIVDGFLSPTRRMTLSCIGICPQREDLKLLNISETFLIVAQVVLSFFLEPSPSVALDFIVMVKEQMNEGKFLTITRFSHIPSDLGAFVIGLDTHITPQHSVLGFAFPGG